MPRKFNEPFDVKVSKLRYTQNSINYKFTDETKNLTDTFQALLKDYTGISEKLLPLGVILHKFKGETDEVYAVIKGNRRLFLFKLLDIWKKGADTIKVKIIGPDSYTKEQITTTSNGHEIHIINGKDVKKECRKIYDAWVNDEQAKAATLAQFNTESVKDFPPLKSKL